MTYSFARFNQASMVRLKIDDKAIKKLLKLSLYGVAWLQPFMCVEVQCRTACSGSRARKAQLMQLQQTRLRLVPKLKMHK